MPLRVTLPHLLSKRASRPRRLGGAPAAPITSTAVALAFALATVGFGAPGPAWAEPALTEFLAVNVDGLRDGDGDASDWIEVHNPTGAAVNLEGWFLTDDPEVALRWAFPAVELPAGGYLVVFASGKDRRDPGGELHTNFRLDGGGEYLALVRADESVGTEFSPAFEPQLADISYGVYGRTSPRLGFFKTPTPGAANPAGVAGFVGDTRFSVDRGFFDQPFDLEITTATEGAMIVYTTDGQEPSPGSILSGPRGTIYEGPVRIETSTVVRAAAFKTGFEPTNVDTHSYFFLEGVIDQPRDPAGFPPSWRGTSADYEMDPDITRQAAYTGRMRDALLSLPTVSFVGEVDDFFGDQGIYANPDQHGVQWERAASVEWINPDGSTEFQVDCGVRIQGGAFRSWGLTKKKSFRLLFKDEYGPGRLRHDVFKEAGAATEFDTVVLRGGANDGYAWGAARDTEQYTRDEFGRRLGLAMGHPNSRGTFVHLYLNGLYWGLYNFVERPNEDFSSTYMGGETEEWDSINSGDVKSGSLSAWNQLVSRTAAVDTPGEYFSLQGRRADGSRDPGAEVLFDAENYIDYMVLNLWGGNWDWPNKNFWFGYRRSPESTGFKFYVWDFENTMGNNRGRSPLGMNAPRNTQWVGQPWENLRDYEEFQVDYGDRVQRYFFNGGLLSPESLKARYAALADQVELAIIAESARWGDEHHSTPQDLADWERERDWMLDTYLDQRTEIVLGQFRSRGLYPAVDAPNLNPHGGVLPAGGEVAVSAGSILSPRDVYVTTDGSDPRLRGGGPNPAALTAAARVNLSLETSTTVKARARSGGTWSALVEVDYLVGNLAAASNLVVSEVHYRPAPATEAERAAGFFNRGDFEFIEVHNPTIAAVELAGVAFVDGVRFAFSEGSITVLEPGGRALVVADRAAFEMRYGTGHPIAGEFADGQLSDGGETLTLAAADGAPIASFRYNDRAPWPEAPDGGGRSLVLRAPGRFLDPGEPASWRPSVAPGGTPGGGDGTDYAAWRDANGLGEPGEDPDGDGLSNLLAYALGADLPPPDGAARLPGALLAPAEDGAGAPVLSLALTFRRRLAADDIDFVVEASGDLLGWSSGSGETELDGALVHGDGTETVTVRDTRPLQPGAGARFLRLRVVRR